MLSYGQLLWQWKLQKERREAILEPLQQCFTDSREAFTIYIPFLRDLIYQRTLDLKSVGRLVVIRWIPGHIGLIGHDKADQSAKDRARIIGEESQRSDGASLTQYPEKDGSNQVFFQNLQKWQRNEKR